MAFGQLGDERAERLYGDVERLDLGLERVDLRVLGGARRLQLNDGGLGELGVGRKG